MANHSEKSSESYNLKRFHDMQKKDYSKAYQEIKSGGKISHWIWYIFPQLKSLGFSSMSKEYGIKDLNEVCAYLKDPLLFSHYLDIVKLVNQKLRENIPVTVLMGSYTDASKLASSLTLFQEAAHFLANSEENSHFHDLENSCSQVLDIITSQGYPPCEQTIGEMARYKHSSFTLHNLSSSHNESTCGPSATSVKELTSTSPQTNKSFIMKTIVDRVIDNIQKKEHNRAK